MDEALSAMYAELGHYLRPITDPLTDRDAFEYLLYRHGWNIELDAELFDELLGTSNLAQAIETFTSRLEQLRAAGAADASFGEAEIATLLEASGAVFTIIGEAPDIDLSRLPEPIADADTWTDFADAIVGTLTSDYLALRTPKLHAVLVAIAVIETDVVEEQPPFRRRHEIDRLRWERLADFLGDPDGHLRQTYRWNDPAGLDHPRLLTALAGLARAFGLHADMEAGVARESGERFVAEVIRPATAEPSLRVTLLELQSIEDGAYTVLGVDVVPVMPPDSAVVDGVLLGPVIEVGGQREIALSRSLRLALDVAANLGANAGLVVTPGDSHWTSDLGTGAVQLEVTSADDAPRFLVGSADTAHVSVSGFRARLRTDSDASTVKAETTVGLTGAGVHPGLHIHIPLADADGFVQGLIGTDSLDLRCAVELGWSTRGGFQFFAEATIGVDLPIGGDLGPIMLLPGRAELDLAVDDGVRATLALTAGFRATVGPIIVSATGLGLELIGRQVSPRADENDQQHAMLLGDLGIDIGFVPPSGAGLSVTGHVVSGGGHLDLDAARGRYAGTMLVSVAGIQVAASAVVSTKDREGRALPSPGFAIFVSMSARFPAVQLGLGFTLNGIGGLLGVHRGTDYDALRAGLTTGSLDSVMFPDGDPFVPDRMLRDVDVVFPVRAHRHLIGPMLLLGWGSPKIADIEVGILIVVGGPIRIQLLGQLTVEIPSPDADAVLGPAAGPILVLKLDVIGEFDPVGGSLALDASLRDSSIAGYALTGDMAARFRWNDDPTFALSFGGFHPDYHPEASFPTLRRLALSITKGSNLSLVAEAYLAVTSNTVQFGGRAELKAKKGSFSVGGWLEFHTLFVLSPFSFAVAVGFDVGLRFKGRTFASIGLTFELSGPRPWRAKGKLKIKITFVTFRLSFNISWGASTPVALPPRPVWPELEAALEDLNNWAAILPPASRRDVVVIPNTEPGTLLLHPHGSLEIRQKVAPFGIELERFGTNSPAGDTMFSVPVLELAGSTQSTDTIDEPFAPAQFLDLTEDERLSRPSFERMPAGIRLGLDRLVDAAGFRNSLTVDHETDLVQPDTVRARASDPGVIVGLAPDSRVYRMSTNGRTRATIEAVSQFKHQGKKPVITVRPDRFTIAETKTATLGPRTVGSLTEAHQAMRRAATAATRSTLTVVAVSELS